MVIVTDGRNGITPHANIPAGDELAKTRAEEALCVTQTLGINPPIFLKYIDGDLALKENINTLDEKYPREITNAEVPFNTDLVSWLNDNLKRTQKRFLTYRIPYNKSDLELGHKASNCHESQYTPEAIDDLMNIVEQTDSLIYLRPWMGNEEIKNTIFD